MKGLSTSTSQSGQPLSPAGTGATRVGCLILPSLLLVASLLCPSPGRGSCLSRSYQSLDLFPLI